MDASRDKPGHEDQTIDFNGEAPACSEHWREKTQARASPIQRRTRRLALSDMHPNRTTVILLKKLESLSLRSRARCMHYVVHAHTQHLSLEELPHTHIMSRSLCRSLTVAETALCARGMPGETHRVISAGVKRDRLFLMC